MFSQELLTNGELNHFSLKERMVEIGKRWHKLSQSQKDKYKKQVEEQQLQYKAELDAWVKVGCVLNLSVLQIKYTFYLLSGNYLLSYWKIQFMNAITWSDSWPKNENSVINNSPSSCSKPVRPSFIFRNQIQIFLMKSESFLTLHIFLSYTLF